MDQLSAHLDQWRQILDEYGSKLVAHVPEQVKTKLINILPDGLEDELGHPLNAHFHTYEQMIEWYKKRTIKSRQKVLREPERLR